MDRFIHWLASVLFTTLIILLFYILYKSYRDILIESLEYAYFSGQIDALQGDIRVDTTTFMWSKSPWNDNNLPIFIYGESKIGKKAKQEMLLKQNF